MIAFKKSNCQQPFGLCPPSPVAPHPVSSITLSVRVLWPLCHASATRLLGDPVVVVQTTFRRRPLFAVSPLH